MSLTSTFISFIDLNNGISKPLCSKNGFICSIKGFTARPIIISMSSKLLSTFTGVSNSLIG